MIKKYRIYTYFIFLQYLNIIWLAYFCNIKIETIKYKKFILPKNSYLAQMSKNVQKSETLHYFYFLIFQNFWSAFFAIKLSKMLYLKIYPAQIFLSKIFKNI